MLIIEQRQKVFVFDDPYRRCYNAALGDHYQWGAWEWLELDVKPEKVEERLTFWRELNDYAVSQRGESAKREFRVVGK